MPEHILREHRTNFFFLCELKAVLLFFFSFSDMSQVSNRTVCQHTELIGWLQTHFG